MEEEEEEIKVSTFGYKKVKKVPEGVTFVIDCRGLPNPWFFSHLRDCAGDDEKLLDFFRLKAEHKVDALLKKAHDVVTTGGHKHIAFACQHGRHRSVAMSVLFKREMKKRCYCGCFFCCLSKFKDVQTLIRRACGPPATTAFDAEMPTLCVPLLMVAAAHYKDSILYLRKKVPHLLDYCYQPHDDKLSQLLIMTNFFRDQATFFHAMFHHNFDFAQRLYESGCPTYTWMEREHDSVWVAKPTTFYVVGSVRLWGTETPGLQSEQWFRDLDWSMNMSSVMSKTEHLFSPKGDVLTLFCELGGKKFAAWRLLLDADMNTIYKAERKWRDARSARRLPNADIDYDYYSPFLGPPGPYNWVPLTGRYRVTTAIIESSPPQPKPKTQKPTLRDLRAEQRYQRRKK
jgi:hypothetical protein